MNNKFNDKSKIVSSINRKQHLNNQEIETEENTHHISEDQIDNTYNNDSDGLNNNESIDDNGDKSNIINKNTNRNTKKILLFLKANPWLIAVLGIVVLIFLFVLTIFGANNSNGTFDSTCDFNLTEVHLTNCWESSSPEANQVIEFEVLNMKDYIIGVTRGEIGSNALDEQIKAQMIAAKTFALSRRGMYDSTTKTITMRSCVADQVYCDPYNGCYQIREKYFSDNGADQWKTKVSYKYDPQPIAGDTSDVYQHALSEEELERFSKLYDEIANYLYLPEDFKGPVTKLTPSNKYATGYLSDTQNFWRAKAEEGMTYEEILKATSTSGVANASSYAGKRLYNLAEDCSYSGSGSSGSLPIGNYTFKFSSDGSINLDNPPEFIAQGLNYVDILHNNKRKIKKIGGCSCQSTSLSIIINALGNLGYMNEYFNGQHNRNPNTELNDYSSMLWYYLAINGFQADSQSKCGGIHNISGLKKDEQEKLGVEISKRISSDKGQKVLDYLRDGWLVQYHVNSSCKSNQGSMSSNPSGSNGHYGVIWGYDASKNVFLIHDNGTRSGANKTTSFSSVNTCMADFIAITKSGRMDKKLDGT